MHLFALSDEFHTNTIFSLLQVFNYDFNMYTHFIHIPASNTVVNDVDVILIISCIEYLTPTSNANVFEVLHIAATTSTEPRFPCLCSKHLLLRFKT